MTPKPLHLDWRNTTILIYDSDKLAISFVNKNISAKITL